MEKLDFFSTGVTVNFKGNKKYGTRLGGLLSLMLVAFIIMIAVFKLTAVADISNHQDSFSEIFHNMTALGTLNGSEINF